MRLLLAGVTACLSAVVLGCATRQTSSPHGPADPQDTKFATPPDGDARVITNDGATSLAPTAAAQAWDAIPFQVWPTLPGTTEGLLIPVVSRWGVHALWAKQLSARATPQPASAGSDTFLFAQNGKSPFAVYFQIATGEAATLLKWNPGGTAAGAYDVRPAAPGDKRLALPNAAHIVAVEVNAGHGSRDNYGPHFVATATKRLDGTNAVPMQVSATLDDALTRWTNFTAAQQAAINTALDRAGQDTPGKPFGAETVTEQEGYFPSWRADTHELVVLYYRRVIRSSSQSELSGGGYTCNKYRVPGNQFCPAPPPPHMVTTFRSYGAELAMELRYDQRGKLLAATAFPAAPHANRLASSGLNGW